MLMPSVPETFFALWGAEIAAVANPVNYFLNASQIAGIMKQAGAKALIAADAVALPRHLAEGRGDPRGAAGAQGVPRRRQVPRMPASSTSKRRSRGPAGRSAGRAQDCPTRDTVAALFHTGGTTGLPKLASTPMARWR